MRNACFAFAQLLLSQMLMISWLFADDMNAAQVKQIVQEKCVDCHNAVDKSGGVDLGALLESENFQESIPLWEKLETVIESGRMPPDTSDPLSDDQRRFFADWFVDQFVLPAGIQHAGHVLPRRLTRDELQNTLEDVLHLSIRSEVTNSRLHVIPDTLIEKFFPTGVIGESGFSNDAETLSRESLNLQKYARCFSLLLSRLDNDSTAREKLFGAATIPLRLDDADADVVLRDFGRSAFRRDLTELEFTTFKQLYEKKKTTQFEAFKSTMLAMLLSTPFLYRFEEAVNGQAAVTDQELAVRLAYFLWSAPPDLELVQLASVNQLQNEDVLMEQVDRMLRDPKRIALSENLGGEWFDYKKLRQKSSVDRRSDRMAGFYRTQYEESLLLFDSFLRYNQSVLRIVDADWIFLNRHQAGIYGTQFAEHQMQSESSLPPISIHFRSDTQKVSEGTYEYRHAPLTLARRQDPNRFGLITTGSTLSATSTENRTSPIRRGVWVMERILGREFEVPEDVPDLEETQARVEKENGKLEFTELLKLHSSQTGCSACHQYIDPVGFALETFDQYGLLRSVQFSTPKGGEKLKWDPTTISGNYTDRRWGLGEALVLGEKTKIFFNYTKGRHRLDIRNVRLKNLDLELVDEHFGFTGGAKRDNVWEFAIPADAPSTGWELIANVKGDGGNDSHGIITVIGDDAAANEDVGSQLPRGKPFRSPAELKDVLLSDYQDQVIDHAIRRVLAYALGRKLLPIDRVAVDEIKRQIRDDDYRFNALIKAVVLSYPFRHKEFQ